MDTVGLVGLGAMGLPVGRLLVQAGYAVSGFDVDEGRREQARAGGVSPASSAAGTAEQASELVLLLVRTADQARVAIWGDRGIAAAGKRRTVVLMSTVGVRAARELDRRTHSLGLDLLDAPVSGGTAGAAAGTLTVMLAGPPQLRGRALPLLRVLGRDIVEVGDAAGAGQAVKLVNQQLMCVNVVGLVEGMRLADALGLPPEVVVETVRRCTGTSWALEQWDVVRGFWERYAPDGSLELLRKDLAHALAEAAEAGLELPASAAVQAALPGAWPRPADG